MIKLGGLIDAHPMGNGMYRLPNGQIVDSNTYLFMESEARRIERNAEKREIASIEAIINSIGNILK